MADASSKAIREMKKTLNIEGLSIFSGGLYLVTPDKPARIASAPKPRTISPPQRRPVPYAGNVAPPRPPQYPFLPTKDYMSYSYVTSRPFSGKKIDTPVRCKSSSTKPSLRGRLDDAAGLQKRHNSPVRFTRNITAMNAADARKEAAIAKSTKITSANASTPRYGENCRCFSAPPRSGLPPVRSARFTVNN